MCCHGRHVSSVQKWHDIHFYYLNWVLTTFSAKWLKLAEVLNPCATTGRDAGRYFHFVHDSKSSAAPCQTVAWQIFKCSVFVLTVCTVQIWWQACSPEAGRRPWLRSPVPWKNLNSWWDRWPMGCSAGTVPYNCKTIPLPHCTAPTLTQTVTV